MVIDSDRERELNLGREWKLPSLKKGEIYLKNSLAKLLGAKVGDIVYVDIDATKLGSFWENILNKEGIGPQLLDQTKSVIIPFKVANLYDDPAGTQTLFDYKNTKGKYGIDKSAAIVELEFFYAELLANINPQLDPFSPQLGYPYPTFHKPNTGQSNTPISHNKL